MDHIKETIRELREKHEILQEDKTPIDVFTFFEIDLGLDAIPFDDLFSKFRAQAAIKADFTGIYLDAEQYNLMERGPEWKLKKLRFTVAHELAHYFLHREIPKPEHFSSLQLFKQWSGTHGGKKYDLEQEANEFAGLLLVPTDTLASHYDEFAKEISKHFPNFNDSNDLRQQFAESVAPKFGVNAPVIAVRLDRDAIWPAS